MQRIILILALSGLAACAATPQSTQLVRSEDTASLFTDAVLLADVPFYPQQDFQCGPAALATILQSDHVPVTPDELVPQVYLPARKGSLQIEVLATARRYSRIAYTLPPSLVSLLKEVQQGRPVLVMQNLGVAWYPRWHYAVVVGYDIGQRELILNSGRIEQYRVSLPLFERTWQRADHWAMVVLTPGELPVDADELSYLGALTALAKTQPSANMEPAYVAGLERWPGSMMLTMGLGNAFYSQGRKQAAIAQFTSALEHDPDYAPAHNNLAQVLWELGDSESALAHAQAAVMSGGSYRETFQATLDAIRAD